VEQYFDGLYHKTGYLHYISSQVHPYMHAYIHTYMYTNIHACMHPCIHVYIHTYMHTYKFTYKHTCVYTCIHACRHTKKRYTWSTHVHIVHVKEHRHRIMSCRNSVLFAETQRYTSDFFNRHTHRKIIHQISFYTGNASMQGFAVERSTLQNVVMEGINMPLATSL